MFSYQSEGGDREVWPSDGDGRPFCIFSIWCSERESRAALVCDLSACNHVKLIRLKSHSD